ncbi:MAG: lipopolysaccharide biosynthesis protein [Candidatus Levybacteria bacterium]|nr:lipopolysaccharide biosynthesis protein [Candidatus Levybacteria bacterium]
MGYTKQAIKGISWIGLLRAATRIVSFGKIAVLARILTPAQFGAYGIAALVLSFLEILTETGVNVVLIQEKETIDRYIPAAFAASIIRGILISAFILLVSPFVAAFFQTPESLPLLQLISVVPLLRGFINPSVVKFQKELQFQKEFWYKFSVFTLDAVMAMIFAYLTKNPASIVFGLIAGVMFEVVLSFVIVKPLPHFRFETAYLTKILHRGKWVTLSGIFHYLFQNGDNIVVGKLLGSSSLGLYQLGYSLAILPVSEVADVVSRVTFPVYVKIAEEKERLRMAFIKTILVITFCTLPLGIILFIFPEDVVRFVFGEQWLGVAPALRVLAIFGVVRAISGFSATLFLSIGKQEYVTIATFVSILVLAITIIPLVMQFGLLGAAFSALFGSIAASFLYCYFVQKVFRQ